MAMTRAQQAQQRLRVIDQEYRAKHAAAHARFNAVFDATMRKHKLTVTSLTDVINFSAEFHADPELAAARADHLDAMEKAKSERDNHAARLPYHNIRFQRMN